MLLARQTVVCRRTEETQVHLLNDLKLTSLPLITLTVFETKGKYMKTTEKPNEETKNIFYTLPFIEPAIELGLRNNNNNNYTM